jgi:hypothetical protein
MGNFMRRRICLIPARIDDLAVKSFGGQPGEGGFVISGTPNKRFLQSKPIPNQWQVTPRDLNNESLHVYAAALYICV